MPILLTLHNRCLLAGSQPVFFASLWKIFLNFSILNKDSLRPKYPPRWLLGANLFVATKKGDLFAEVSLFSRWKVKVWQNARAKEAHFLEDALSGHFVFAYSRVFIFSALHLLNKLFFTDQIGMKNELAQLARNKHSAVCCKYASIYFTLRLTACHLVLIERDTSTQRFSDKGQRRLMSILSRSHLGVVLLRGVSSPKPIF